MRFFTFEGGLPGLEVPAKRMRGFGELSFFSNPPISRRLVVPSAFAFFFQTIVLGVNSSFLLFFTLSLLSNPSSPSTFPFSDFYLFSSLLIITEDTLFCSCIAFVTILRGISNGPFSYFGYSFLLFRILCIDINR